MAHAPPIGSVFNQPQTYERDSQHGRYDKVPEAAGASSELELLTPERRTELLKKPAELIWLTNFVVSERPTPEERNFITAFLEDDYEFAPAKCYWPPSALHIKIGYDDVGVYINSHHYRRYVAVLSAALAGAGYPPPAELPEQDRRVTAQSRAAEELRDQLLRQTFAVADKNGDGVVSKAELRLLLRRVNPSMPTAEVDNLFNSMDQDHSGSITSGEFVNWLKTSAAQSFTNVLTSQVLSHKDFIKAAFRLWDANGDGTISCKEMVTTMKTVCPKMKESDLQAMFRQMDTNGSGGVDYAEFVNFLWQDA